MKTLTDAIKLACDAHSGQFDKGGQPYILHPLRVMMMLSGEKRMIAAVLHDVVEDAGIELSLISHWFGAEVAQAVDALSRREGESYGDFIERCANDPIACSVKWADLQDNMDLSRIPDPGEADYARMEKYRKAADLLTERHMFRARDTHPEGRDA